MYSEKQLAYFKKCLETGKVKSEKQREMFEKALAEASIKIVIDVATQCEEKERNCDVEILCESGVDTEEKEMKKQQQREARNKRRREQRKAQR
jgi:hypothetical protein